MRMQNLEKTVIKTRINGKKKPFGAFLFIFNELNIIKSFAKQEILWYYT